MKIALAQIRPCRGDINQNIQLHLKMIEKANQNNCHCIFFPELSLSGYEPSKSRELAMDPDDERFSVFQKISNNQGMAIGLGIPLSSEDRILISMIIFTPDCPVTAYTKSYLHPDEEPYFAAGRDSMGFEFKDQRFAIAICYEIYENQKRELSKQWNADFYIASTAKTYEDVQSASQILSTTALQLNKPVLLTNCTGMCEGFRAGGLSAIWNKNGQKTIQMEETQEGLIIYDSILHTSHLVDLE